MTQHPEHIAYILGIAGAFWMVYFHFSTVKVFKISDGDGFRAYTAIRKRDLKIRMHGIDAPEISQLYGQQCANALASRILGKRVWIKQMATDKYGRFVCKVSDIWGDVCAHQVFWGHAHNYKDYGGKYSFHESFARGEWCFGWFRQGLWKQNNPMPPWEWRKKNKGQVIELPSSKKAKRK